MRRSEFDVGRIPGKRAQGLGQLLIEDAQSGARDRLNIARYHVNVVLQPPVALVQIDQSFYNPFNRQEEGTFVFNLPQGASVSRFAMYVTPSTLVEGELIERERAADIYQSIVDKRRDPAILEQIGDNLFRMRVFPIFAKKTKRILLDYTIPLKPQHGEYRFQLPLLSDLEPIWDFGLSGVVRGPTRDGSLSSFSHPDLQFQRRDDGSFSFEMEKRLFQPETDFALTFQQHDDGEVRLRSQLAPPVPVPPAERSANPDWSDPWSLRSATYFIASIEPEPQAKSAAPSPADVLVLADTSAGMIGAPLVRDSLRTIVHNLGVADRFRLMAVDVAARPLHEGWIQPGSTESAAALTQFNQEFCLGGTDLATSVQEALESFPEQADGRRRVVIYVGDGEDTTMTSLRAPVSVDQLALRLQEAQATFVGVVARRAADGSPLLSQLARSTAGLCFDLTGGPSGHGDLFRWLLAGAPSPEKIHRVEVDGAVEQDLLFPTAWLPGETLHVLGRVPWTDEVRLKLTTSRTGEKVVRQWKLKAENDADDHFIGRLWAQKKLDQLRRRESLPGTGMVRDQIVGLSQEWSLLTPYTAFLVLESEQDYERWQVDRRVRRRYWKPAEALPREPLSRDWLARVTPDESERKAEAVAKRVARTMDAARKALKEEHYALAHGLLQGMRREEWAKESEEFARLFRRAAAEVQRETLLENLGPHQGLFDPATRSQWTRFTPRIAPLLIRSLGTNAEFLRWHPHVQQLLVDIHVEPRTTQDGFNLEELANTLAAVTGTNVVLDRRALEDISMGTDSPLDLYGVGQMSLRNYLRFVLAQQDLVMIEEPNRILITTDHEAESRLATRVYPVADLYLKNRVPRLDSLANPYFDREELVRKRIQAKLNRPISVEFQETPLEEVAYHLAGLLDDTVLIDQKALEDVARGLSEPVTADWEDVPARQVLEWILDPAGPGLLRRGRSPCDHQP